VQRVLSLLIFLSLASTNTLHAFVVLPEPDKRN
jgi:hypothetical protein